MRKIRNGVRVTPCLLCPDVLTSFLSIDLSLICIGHFHGYHACMPSFFFQARNRRLRSDASSAPMDVRPGASLSPTSRSSLWRPKKRLGLRKLCANLFFMTITARICLGQVAGTRMQWLAEDEASISVVDRREIDVEMW